MKKLIHKGYSGVKRWYNKVIINIDVLTINWIMSVFFFSLQDSIIEYDYILTFINYENSHWTLLVKTVHCHYFQ